MSEISDYERAISAYQFQVERYHTWMNYYSLFEGALLVALYSVDRNEVGHLVYLLIPVLGFIVSLCWLSSIVGHRCWMNSWLDIIKYLEEKDENKKNKIYNSFSSKQSKKDFLSTQVITQIFISIVIVAWSIVLLNSSLFAFIGGIIAIILAHKLYKKEDSCIHSNLKNMKPLILSLLIIMITFSSCDNMNRKDNNNSQDYLEIKEQNADNKKTEEVKDPMVSLDKSLMMTAIDELLYNPDFLGYVINGASITRTMVNNPLKIQRWINNTRNSDYPFVFIKAKINYIYPLENGCNIIANSNSLSRELSFYVANDEELYDIKRGDEVYFWALPMEVETYRCYFEIAFVSKYIHTLVEKISDYSILYVELVTTNSETNKYNLNSKLTKMEHYSGLNFNDELRDMIEKTVGKHVEVYNFTYDKYFKDKGETEVVGIDRSKGFLIIDIE